MFWETLHYEKLYNVVKNTFPPSARWRLAAFRASGTVPDIEETTLTSTHENDEYQFKDSDHHNRRIEILFVNI
jgi:hypothetical protein